MVSNFDETKDRVFPTQGCVQMNFVIGKGIPQEEEEDSSPSAYPSSNRIQVRKITTNFKKCLYINLFLVVILLFLVK